MEEAAATYDGWHETVLAAEAERDQAEREYCQLLHDKLRTLEAPAAPPAYQVFHEGRDITGPCTINHVFAVVLINKLTCSRCDGHYGGDGSTNPSVWDVDDLNIAGVEWLREKGGGPPPANLIVDEAALSDWMHQHPQLVGEALLDDEHVEMQVDRGDAYDCGIVWTWTGRVTVVVTVEPTDPAPYLELVERHPIATRLVHHVPRSQLVSV